MGYVAVRGGIEAIEASIESLKYERLKKGAYLSIPAIEGGLRALVDQVMAESSLYDERIAALAIKQAEGSPEEAVFIMRAYRSTLPRKHYSIVVSPERMSVERRISSSFKSIPGGQILGSSCDYTHRLIDQDILAESEESIASWLGDYRAQYGDSQGPSPKPGLIGLPKVVEYLRKEGLLAECPRNDEEPRDVTKSALEFPSRRSERLQILARGQTGAMTALGYAALRGYGMLHPTVGELRVGFLPVSVPNPYGKRDDEGDSYYVGEIKVTEVETLVPVSVPRGQGRVDIEFELGYGICYGQNETKAIAMSLLDQCLEKGDKKYPTQDEEFVLMHIDSVEATGFISHLKLPHYVTFQSKLDSVRKAKSEREGEA